MLALHFEDGYWIYWPLIRTTRNYKQLQRHRRRSQITTASAKHFPAFCAFTSRSLVTASNTGDSSVSRSQVLSLQTTLQNWLGRPNYLPYNASARTTVEKPLSKSNSTLSCVSVAAETSLLSRCLKWAVDLQYNTCTLIWGNILQHISIYCTVYTY
jgi:hypothetical protein